MANIEIHKSIHEKLKTKHKVSQAEIEQCFSNADRGFLLETMEENATDDPPTHWFIAPTDMGRELFVAFMYFEETKKIVIKTAYEPNDNKRRLYQKLTGQK